MLGSGLRGGRLSEVFPSGPIFFIARSARSVYTQLMGKPPAT